MARTVHFQLFGAFTVDVDGRTVDETAWSGSRPRELVQLLALSPDFRLVRDQVIDALWPHLDLDAGGANLRKAAHHARLVLGEPGAVVLRSGQVLLFPDAEVSTDLDAFVREAAEARRSGDAEACGAVADRASAGLVPQARYEDWAADAIRQTDQLRRDLLRAAGEWEQLVDLDPTDEHAYQQLMGAALDRGARAAAIRWYARARGSLAAELGVPPGPELESLHERAVDGLVGDAPDLVGRDVDLAQAAAALGGEGPRRAGSVVVRGPAGIGKTAFSEQLAAACVEDHRMVVRWAAAVGSDQPFGPLLRLVEELLLTTPDASARLPAPAWSILASITDVAPDAVRPVEGPLTRHQVLGAVTALLRAAAPGERTLLVLDDLHEADDATVDAALHLATSAPGVVPVLVYRPESASAELVEGVDRLERSVHTVAVDLGPLEDEVATELARRNVDPDADTGVVERVVSMAEGNPFAITELARASVPSGDEVPRSVADAITRRLVALDADTVAMLQRLALTSDDLDAEVVVAVTGADEGAAFTLLDRALDAGVLVVAGGRYRFRHDLVRHALAAQVAPHQRLAVHRDTARRLADAGAEPAAISRQWLLADQPGEAAPWCLDAAREAMRVGAFRDARRHVAPVLAHDRSHAEALQIDAESLDMLGEPRALAAYDEAIAAAAEDVADDLVIARALAQIKQGDPAGGLAAIQGATPRSVMGRLNEALTYAGAAALGATDPALGTEKAAECRRIALESGDRAGIVIAAWAHAAAAHARGDLHDSVIDDLRDTEDLPDLAVRVFDGHLCMTQRFLYGSRPYEEVIRFAEELTDEAIRRDAARGHAFGVTLRAEALMLSGRLQEARSGFEEALRLHRATGGPTGEAHALERLAYLAHTAGRQAEAESLVEEALDLARVSDIGFHLLDRIYGARIRISADPRSAAAAVEEAEHAVQGPLETCPGCRIHLAVPAAIAAARAGDLERAHRYEEASDYLANVVMRLPAWYAAYDEVRANVALAEGDETRARSHFVAAADAYAEAGHVLDEQRCREHAS